MIATIYYGLFAVVFAYLAKYKHAQWGLKASFAIIFLFLALRYNFGNDYEWYSITFNDLSEFDITSLFDSLLPYEPGWVLLNWLFKDLGFIAMTAVLALLNCVIYYRFIIKYVPVKFYWLAVFLYVFYPNFMLIHSSAMRQSISIMLFIYSLDYLIAKKAFRYFLCIGLASLFHFTALILAPVYLLSYTNRKIRLVSAISLISIYAALFIFGNYLLPYIMLFVSNFSPKYEYYQNAGAVNTGLGFIYYSVLFILTLYFERMQNRDVSLVFKIAIISFLIIPLALVIDMTGRLGMYFAPATIVVYPMIATSLKNFVSKAVYLTVLLVLTSYQFIQFFYSEIYHDYYWNYQTILSAPQ